MANQNYLEAEGLLEKVVKMRESTLPAEHTHGLDSQHVLALAYMANRGNLEAEELLEHVVKLREMTQLVEHPDRLISQHELALAYMANGSNREAQELLEKVVEIRDTFVRLLACAAYPAPPNPTRGLPSGHEGNRKMKHILMEMCAHPNTAHI
jgi:Tfp pilus assembly protein PilF